MPDTPDMGCYIPLLQDTPSTSLRPSPDTITDTDTFHVFFPESVRCPHRAHLLRGFFYTVNIKIMQYMGDTRSHHVIPRDPKRGHRASTRPQPRRGSSAREIPPLNWAYHRVLVENKWTTKDPVYHARPSIPSLTHYSVWGGDGARTRAQGMPVAAHTHTRTGGRCGAWLRTNGGSWARLRVWPRGCEERWGAQ